MTVDVLYIWMNIHSEMYTRSAGSRKHLAYNISFPTAILPHVIDANFDEVISLCFVCKSGYAL